MRALLYWEGTLDLLVVVEPHACTLACMHFSIAGRDSEPGPRRCHIASYIATMHAHKEGWSTL